MMFQPGTFEEEPPVLLWGLDPVFSAFAKLYIKDIHELKQSQKISGMFFYNGHPIRQVDVLGIVVHKREREKCYSYGVDDSTGVITCTCWKKTDMIEIPPLAAGSHQSTFSGLNLVEMMKKLQDEERQNANVEIGEVIRVRGAIRVFREESEIVSSIYHKVDDPTCDAQIYRMLHLPHLYRDVYDLPFEIPQNSDTNMQTTSNLTSQLSEQVEEFLTKNKVQNFYPRELETIDSLMSLINSKMLGTQGSKSCPTTKEVRSLFKDVIGLLQKKGLVFQKSHNCDVYHVTDQDKELQKTTHGIIQADCKRHRHAEKGCHFLHILNCVQQRYSSSVSEAVMQRVLNELESDSQIVSTMEKYYTAF